MAGTEPATVMVAEADFVPSAAEIAVRVTVKLAPELGAVYIVGVPLGVAVGETEPHADAEQLTLQVTPLPAESLMTVAVNCAVAPACTVAVASDSETLMAGGGGGGGTLAEPPPHPELLPASSTAISETPFFDLIASLSF